MPAARSRWPCIRTAMCISAPAASGVHCLRPPDGTRVWLSVGHGATARDGLFVRRPSGQLIVASLILVRPCSMFLSSVCSPSRWGDVSFALTQCKTFPSSLNDFDVVLFIFT